MAASPNCFGTWTLAAGASFNPASTLLVGTAGTLNLANVGMTVSQAKLQGVLNGSGTLTARSSSSTARR